jgi:putative heme iron utilization protein
LEGGLDFAPCHKPIMARMTDPYDKVQHARALLLSQRHGVLATLSLDVPGYPFGSVTPYVLDTEGAPLLLISAIAQHTKNILADPRVSLTIHDSTSPDPQEGARLTWIGDAAVVPEQETAAHARYRAYFPQTANYSQTHDFALYRIHLKRTRFIGGFGRIYWIEPQELLRRNPFAASEAGIVAHMNEDHSHNLVAYCKAFKGMTPTQVVMQGIDADGFDVLADGRHLRFTFERPISTPEEARLAMVQLAKAARTAAST